MSDNFCLPKTHLLIILCILIGVTSWYTHYIKNKEKELRFNIENNYYSFINKRKVLENRDAEVKYNDFKPPERRLPEYQYPPSYIKQNFNISTRGEPDNYQLMGLLLRENTESAFNLFGRQTFPGSNQYEYYAQGKLHDNQIKIPIYKKDNKELYNDDEVKILGTDDKKGLFKVKLYKLDAPRYNPYDY